MQVKASHMVYVGLAGSFGLLLYFEGWTLPLKIVAAMLPVAGYMVFT